LEAGVRRAFALGCVVIAGCSDARIDSAAGALSEVPSGRELIPAEWTVAEDTSPSGEITTVSLQLPAAKDIAGLMAGEAPRLALRCLDGKVAAFIDTRVSDSADEPDSSSSVEPIQIQLDSAPTCE
jgi:hypothetical protein